MECKFIHIYYGDGKGKTTAATGLAYRCAKRGKKVLFTAFLKGKDSGEFLGDSPFEMDDFDFCNKFWYELTDEEKQEAENRIKNQIDSVEKRAENYDMILLDEFLDAVMLGCIDKQSAICFVKNICKQSEVVITGHCRIDELFELADYITEMKKEKHPYDKGISARCGIEF